MFSNILLFINHKMNLFLLRENNNAFKCLAFASLSHKDNLMNPINIREFELDKIVHN